MENNKIKVTVFVAGQRFNNIKDKSGKSVRDIADEIGGRINSLVVSPDDDLILISESGVIIRILASTVRICARPSKGVTVMKIKGDNKVVTVADVPHEEEEQAEKTEETDVQPADEAVEAVSEETADE